MKPQVSIRAVLLFTACIAICFSLNVASATHYSREFKFSGLVQRGWPFRYLHYLYFQWEKAVEADAVAFNWFYLFLDVLFALVASACITLVTLKLWDRGTIRQRTCFFGLMAIFTVVNLLTIPTPTAVFDCCVTGQLTDARFQGIPMPLHGWNQDYAILSMGWPIAGVGESFVKGDEMEFNNMRLFPLNLLLCAAASIGLIAAYSRGKKSLGS